MLKKAQARFAPHGLRTAELTLTMLLWQASTGVFLIAIVQQYLPQQLDANAAFPVPSEVQASRCQLTQEAPRCRFPDRSSRSP